MRNRGMEEGGWEAFSRGSAVRCAGRAGFQSNVAVALGNWGAAANSFIAAGEDRRHECDEQADPGGGAARPRAVLATLSATRHIRERSDLLGRTPWPCWTRTAQPPSWSG